jgi:RHS repeat-associated protein
VQNYYPFGQNIPKWSTSALNDPTRYRFGFNDKENDNEWVKQDYGARIYDQRVGRFLSVDPLTNQYPWYTPYQFAGNKPLQFVDLDGLEEYDPNTKTYSGIGPIESGPKGGEYTDKSNTLLFSNQKISFKGIAAGNYTLIGMNDGKADYWVARKFSRNEAGEISYKDDWTLGTDVATLSLFRKSANRYEWWSMWKDQADEQGGGMLGGYLSVVKNPFNWVAGAHIMLGAVEGGANIETPNLVSGEESIFGTLEGEIPALRLSYETEVKNLSSVEEEMRLQGKPINEIAETLHGMRRDLGVKYKGITPPDMLETIYARNMQKYGDKLGPTIEYLRKQGKSWEDIIESAKRPGGKDLNFKNK